MELQEALHERLATLLRNARKLSKRALSAPVSSYLITRTDTEEDQTPAPLTLQHAIEIVEAEGAHIVRHTERSIREAVAGLILPEYRDFVLAHVDIAKRWPWPMPMEVKPFVPTPITYLGTPHMILAGSVTTEQTKNLMNGGWIGLAALLWSSEKTLGDTSLRGPLEIAPIELANWAQKALARMDPQKFIMGNLSELERPHALGPVIDYGGLPGIRWITKTPDDESFSVEVLPGSLELMYIAEDKAAQLQPRPLKLSMMPVDPPAVRTMTTLGGGNPRKYDNKIKSVLVDNEEKPCILEFTWEDGVQLDLRWDDGAGPLLAVAAKYGPPAVRDMLVFYAQTWAARARANQAIWWWPDEHLEIAGLEKYNENRNRLRKWLAAMQRSILTVHYRTGKPITGKLITEVATDGSAKLLHFHPALYHGITKEDGSAGKHFWPLPSELLQLPANKITGYVHILAPVLGSMWRANLSDARKNGRVPEATVKASGLAERLNIYQHTDRQKDTHAAEILRRTMTVGMQTGLLGSWRVERGSLERLDGVMVATPGEASVKIVNGDVIPRPGWVPATGEDLTHLKNRWGKSFDEVGNLVDVPGSTLRRLSKSHFGRPLPGEVRGALRSYFRREI